MGPSLGLTGRVGCAVDPVDPVDPFGAVGAVGAVCAVHTTPTEDLRPCQFGSLQRRSEEESGVFHGPACESELFARLLAQAMSLDRLEGKIRNSIRIVEEEAGQKFKLQGSDWLPAHWFD